ncbi:ATP-dependent DNA helicase [Bdellovibrionota bacterium FG-2]
MSSLSSEQRAVVESWGRGMAVLAGAGSGKTTTLVAKCEALLRRNPEARFAAISFTERSASDLRVKLTQVLGQLKPLRPLESHWVMTIHGFCGSVLREFPRAAGKDGEERVLSELESKILWERSVESLWADELPAELSGALDLLLFRETVSSLVDLLDRLKRLAHFGAGEGLSCLADPCAQTLNKVFAFVLARYEQKKMRQGAIDFDDLEKGAQRVLAHPEIARVFQKRFDLILVDEFQDTNPVQAQIVSRFVKSDFSNLCVVGDPKQSIYRFRDADVAVFEEFCAKLPERHSLTWNFRSRPGIIHFVNELCEQTFRGSPVAFEALVPKRPPKDSEPSVLRLDIEDPGQLAAWILAEREKGVPLEDMAILMRRIRGNERWLTALISAGVPVVVGSGGFFWDEPRVREMVALLRWWEQQDMSVSAISFLRAPWVGIPDTQIDEWVSMGGKSEKSALWSAFIASAFPIAQALAPLLKKSVRPAEVLRAVFEAMPQAEQELGVSYLGLWHRVEELSSAGVDFSGVVREISQAIKEGRRAQDLPPPRNLGQLIVMTLHGAKGLEFPHVILVDFGKKPRGADAPLLYWDRGQGAHLASRTPEGERDRKNQADLKWRQFENEKELAESKRLFYVALTRPQERLVLVCEALSKPEKILELEEKGKTYHEDWWRAWLDSSMVQKRGEWVVQQSVSKLKLQAKPMGLAQPYVIAKNLELRSQIRPRHSVSEWNLLARCPRAYEWTYVRPVAPVPKEPKELQEPKDLPKFQRVGGGAMTQVEVGTEVHQALERQDWARLDDLEILAGRYRVNAERIRAWAESSLLMRPEIKPTRRVWAELAFEIPMEGGHALVGAMDRLVLDDGKAQVIDFKITTRPAKIEDLRINYQTQMALYAEAVRKLTSHMGDCLAVEAWIVNISGAEINEYKIETGKTSNSWRSLQTQASEIASGAPGIENFSARCEKCPFFGCCPKGGLATLN